MQDAHQSSYFVNLKRFFNTLTAKKAILIIVVVGIIVFFNSLRNPFILDDISQIVSSPAIHTIRSIPSFFYASMTYPKNVAYNIFHLYYKPLFFITYTLLYSFSRNSPIAFHVLQLTIHITNTVLLFIIFSRLLNQRIAFVLSLIFLVHPVNSETVIYIAALQDVLFVFFGLLALKITIEPMQKLFSYTRLFFISLLLLLSLFSKESGILFLIILLLYSWLFTRRNFMGISIAIAAISALYVSLRFIASHNSVGLLYLTLIQRTSFWVRLTTVPRIFFYYLSEFFLPIHLATTQAWLVRYLDFQNFFLPLLLDTLVLVYIFIFGRVLYKKRNHLFNLYLFFALWFIVGLGIHLQIIPLDATVEDRWFYFPMIGLLGILGILLSPLNKRFSDNHFLKIISTVFFSITLVLLSILTIIRNSQWQTPLRLYSHDVQYAESPLLYNNYGNMLIDTGRFDEAKTYFEQSIALDSKIGKNINSLAAWYETKRDFVNAKKLYWENIINNQELTAYIDIINISYDGLARIALVDDKNIQEAKRLSESALRVSSSDSNAMEILSVSEYFLGEKNEALQTVQKLYSYAPDAANTLYLLIKGDNLLYPQRLNNGSVFFGK